MLIKFVILFHCVETWDEMTFIKLATTVLHDKFFPPKTTHSHFIICSNLYSKQYIFILLGFGGKSKYSVGKMVKIMEGYNSHNN